MPPLTALLGYAVALVMCSVGVAVLAGWLGMPGAPVQLRLTLGVVLVLFGIYRAVVTMAQSRERR